MKRKGLALGVVLLATAGAAAAIAAGGHRGMGHHGGDGWHHGSGEWGGGHHRGKGHRLMNLKQRDADGDGAVTLDEFLKPRGDRFTELDANKDGALDATELTVKMAQRAGHRQRMMMAKLDANGDGEVSKDEFDSARHFGRGGRHGWGKGDHGHRGPGRHRRMGGEDAAAAPPAPAPADAQGATQGSPQTDADAKAAPSDKQRMSREDRRAQRFMRMDANGDGKLTAADIEARAGSQLDYAKRKKMHVLDKDKDGKVTVEEFTARAKQRFADLDLDGDGKISATDLPPRMAERWQPGGKR